MKKEQAMAEMDRIMYMRHYAEKTIENYVHWTGRFFEWLKKHRDCDPSPRGRMEGFLSDLALDDCSASTQHQAFCALLFFFRHVIGQEPGDVDALRARRPKFSRHAPSREQVAALLDEVRDTPVYPYRLIMDLIYGCGLRVSEPVNLRLRDLNFSTGEIVLKQAKGAKDRFAKMPPSLIEPLRRQVEVSLRTHERAVAAEIQVKLPHRLHLKYQKAGFQPTWWWLFPAAHPCVEKRPANGERRKVWWHCLESGVQKALREAGVRAGMPGEVTPHHLRHAFGTHALAAGASVRDLQEIFGHQSLETTMLYLHPEIDRVVSPLESLTGLRKAA